MSGLYQHNHRCLRNDIPGGCSSPWWKENVERNRTFAVHLQKAGWRTFYGGKYLNQYAMDKAGVWSLYLCQREVGKSDPELLQLNAAGGCKMLNAGVQLDGHAGVTEQCAGAQETAAGGHDAAAGG